MTARLTHLGFDPLLPLAWIFAIAALSLMLALWCVLHKQRGAVWRLLAAASFSLLLANPMLRQEQRQMLPDIGLIVIDGSASMAFDARGKAAAEAAKLLQSRQQPDLIWRSVISGGPNHSNVFEALSRGLSAIPPERYAGSVVFTDGLVHDVPTGAVPSQHPINVVITGTPDAIDRRVRIHSAPAFAIIGQTSLLKLKVEDSESAPVAVTVRIPDQPDRVILAAPGDIVKVPIILKRRGSHDIIVQAASRAGDILPGNDQAIISMQGVRERLNVLLVTGSPSPGARLWRDTLKADSSIDLIHFTILRTPHSVDAASNSEMALIPFPVEQLFEQRLSRFDLVIFDRYTSLDLLQPAYFSAVGNYVRKGGALLVVAGPEYVSVDSLANTPLQPVLPVMPRSDAPEAAFMPKLSALGLRHPVTQNLQAPWGPWYRYARVAAVRGQSLMQTPNGDPLLQIATIERGRVATLLSDQLWLWARMDQGGPWNDLVRRISHWLMKEPDLDSEQLNVRLQDGALRIDRRSDSPGASLVQLTRPNGRIEMIPLQASAAGASATIAAGTRGLYRVRSGALERSINTAAGIAEWQEARPTATRLSPVAKASGGSLSWLNDGLPAAVRLHIGGRSRTGLALVRNKQGRLTGMSERPLLPRWIWFLLVSGALALGWGREADRLRR
jgi:Putative glutamine amidotransferase